jgi:hypothetical protein
MVNADDHRLSYLPNSNLLEVDLDQVRHHYR